MKMSIILNRAWIETLRKLQAEQEHLEKYPNNRITMNRIKILSEEESELHEMILIEENK